MTEDRGDVQTTRNQVRKQCANHRASHLTGDQSNVQTTLRFLDQA
jgi:hypothetical protein